MARRVAIGLAHARAGHADLAVLTLGSALERWPDEPALYGALGRIWLDTAQSRGDRVALSKAREALARVASDPGASSDLLVLYGRALLMEGDIEAAERALQQATARFPVDPSAFPLYASTAERRTHIDAARDALLRYEALEPADAEFVSRASRIAALSLRLNDAKTAVAWLTRAATSSPGDLRVAAALADAQLRAGDRGAAETTVARGLDVDPRNAPLLSLARRIRDRN